MRRSFKSSLGNLGWGIIGLILLFLLWEIIGLIVFTGNENGQFKDFLPIPAFKALFRLFRDHVFWTSVAASLRRVGIGLVLAFGFGFTWGVILAASKKMRQVTTLPMQFVRMVSPLSWMPIAILVLSTFEQSIYFLIMMASVWPIIHNTSQGLLDVPPSWINMARIQGASRFQVLTKVLLPSRMHS